MNKTQMFGYTIGAALWLIGVVVQLTAIPLAIAVTIWVTWHGILLLVIAALLTLVVTSCFGGINAVPHLFWVAKRHHQLRIVEVESGYAIQMKWLGSWIYISAPSGAGDHVFTARNPEWSIRSFTSSQRKGAENQLDNFEAFLGSCRNDQQVAPEVLDSINFTNGTRNVKRR